ncbi:MAG TPA: hypothetical protein VMH88_15220 [Gemmatimonadales bacterium]|nr:hypothetical protein [Gemmatimonadales bacterium]
MRVIHLVLIGALGAAAGCESSATTSFGRGISGGGGGGTTLQFTIPPSSGTAGALIGAVQVSAINVFGATDTSFSGSVSIALGSGAGSAVLGGTTTVTASSGVATFNDLTVSTSGTYTLVASASGFSNATSSSFTISP